MKKIISILYILCFINCGFLNAQRIPIRLPKKPTNFTIPKVGTSTAARAAIAATAARAEAATAATAARVATRTLGKKVLPETLLRPHKRLSPSYNNLSRYGSISIPNELDYDMENRGFIRKEHSDNSSSFFETIDNNDLTVPSSLNSHASPPKVNLDKLRLKVMMKQNRLNKNEMKEDEFIIIGLLNFNEYGEPSITDYVA